MTGKNIMSTLNTLHMSLIQINKSNLLIRCGHVLKSIHLKWKKCIFIIKINHIGSENYDKSSIPQFFQRNSVMKINAELFLLLN